MNNRRSRIFALILSFCMIFSLLPTTALADATVTNSYILATNAADLASALNTYGTAAASGNTVTLSGSFTAINKTIYINGGANITLKMDADTTLTVNSIVVYGGANVTIEGGKIEQASGDNNPVVQVGNWVQSDTSKNSAGTVRISGVEITGNTGAFVQVSGSALTVEGASKITCANSFGISTNGARSAGTQITITGGVISGRGAGIYLPVGALTVSEAEGCTTSITGDAGIVVRGGQLKVTGGTIAATGNEKISVGDANNGDGPVEIDPAGIAVDKHSSYADGSVAISGGTVSAANGQPAVSYTEAGEEVDQKGAPIEVTGGTFTNGEGTYDVEDYYPTSSDGSAYEQDENGTVGKAYSVTVSVSGADEKPENTVEVETTLGKYSEDEGDLKAIEGTEVTVTVETADGYEAKVEVSGDVEVTEDEEDSGEYTFEMPEAGVTVTVTFSKIEYTIDIKESENGTVTAKIGEEVVKTATYGQEVTLVIEPEEGYELDTLTVDETDVASTSIEDNKYTITVIDNVSVSATFKQSDYTVKVENYLGDAQSEKGGQVALAENITAEKVHFDDTIELTVTVNEGYRLKSLTYAVEDGDETSIPVTDGAVSYSFKMPAGDVTVKATFEAITYLVNLNFDSDKGSAVQNPFEVTVGETVELTVTPKPGYKITANDITVIRSDGVEEPPVVVAAGNSVDPVSGEGTYTFTMPASDVIVTIEFTPIEYELTIGAAQNGTVKVNDSSDTPQNIPFGTEVIVTAEADSNYRLDSLKVNEEEVAFTDNGDGTYTYTFTMPAEAVTIAVEFGAAAYTVTVEAGDGGTVTATPSRANQNDTITVTVTPDNGYQLKSLTVTKDGSGDDDEDIEVTDNQFTMPDGNVTVTAEFARKAVPPPAASDPKDTVEVAKTKNGSVKISDTTAKAGDKVTVTATPDEGYELDKITVTDANGKPVELTENEDGSYSFVMPAATPVTVTATFAEKSEEDPSGIFVDVPAGAWYEEAVNYVFENGLMVGTSLSTFSPNSNASRAMIATVLYRLAGEPAAPKTLSFADVAAGEYYTDAVAWAAANEVVKGYDDVSFGPNDPVTREQLAVMIWRYAGEEQAAADLSVFVDADSVSDWAVAAMAWAVENGIIKGDDLGQLNPAANATRAEIAAILMRFCEK